MKEKLLNKEQILISIDRLTRFKNPKEKYFRVFNDIIQIGENGFNSKKNKISKYSAVEITEFAQDILNKSIEVYADNKKISLDINKTLKNYENSVFFCDNETNIYLDNKINYWSACELISENSPINLRWLKSLKDCCNLNDNRESHALKFPIRKVILVEGLTEETLLPAFGEVLNCNFNKNGIQVIPAGGKSQVVKLYYRLADELKIPIYVLLDKDANENICQIKPKLRLNDKIHLISCGEFEDLLPKSLIIKTVNNSLENFATITEADLVDNMPETKNLENIYKVKGLHEFKKAEFAKLVRDNLDFNSEISQEIKDIIQEICS